MRIATRNFGILVFLWVILIFGVQGTVSNAIQDPLQISLVTSSDFDRNLIDQMVFENSPEIAYFDISGPPGTSDLLTSEDLIDSDALWVMLSKGTSAPQVRESIPISILEQYVASGGQVLFWIPTITELPIEYQEFLGISNIISVFSHSGGGPGPSGYPLVSLKVTNSSLIPDPFYFSQDETLTFEGYGSIIELQSVMEEIVQIEQINVRGNETIVNTPAIAYSYEETGGSKWIVTTTPLNPRTETRFFQLITSVCQSTIASFGGSIPTITSTSQTPLTTLVTTSQSEPSALLDFLNFPFELTTLQTQIIVAFSAISLLAITGAAVKAASIPPPIVRTKSLRDFLKRLLWYLLYPFIWIFSHVVYDPVIRRLKEDDVMANTTRQTILHFIEEQGVAYLREIERAVGSGIFGLMWHLQVLEDFGHIRHTRIGNYLVYYLREYSSMDPSSLELSFLLKNENARDIITLIMDHPGTYQAEIARALGLHHDSVRYHLRPMKEQGLIESFSDGRITRYFIIDQKRDQISTILQNNVSN